MTTKREVFDTIYDAVSVNYGVVDSEPVRDGIIVVLEDGSRWLLRPPLNLTPAEEEAADGADDEDDEDDDEEDDE